MAQPASQPPIRGVPEFLLEEKGPGAKLTPHFHLVPSLKMHVAVPLLPTQCLCGVEWNNFTTYEMKNQQMSLIQFYSFIDGSLHVSGPQAHLQESSHSCSHNHWFSVCIVQVTCSVCCGRSSWSPRPATTYGARDLNDTETEPMVV